MRRAIVVRRNRVRIVRMLRSAMQTCTATDLVHLERAIELARNGNGRANPNPVVGAVIAVEGSVLGEGWHDELGGPHAEINAIAGCAGADLGAATLYVSLEPCCHHGRTPPCTDAIIAAGIKRVVVGSDDPTEKASGRGLGILRDEGVEVVLEDAVDAAAAGAAAQAGAQLSQIG